MRMLLADDMPDDCEDSDDVRMCKPRPPDDMDKPDRDGEEHMDGDRDGSRPEEHNDGGGDGSRPEEHRDGGRDGDRPKHRDGDRGMSDYPPGMPEMKPASPPPFGGNE